MTIKLFILTLLYVYLPITGATPARADAPAAITGGWLEGTLLTDSGQTVVIDSNGWAQHVTGTRRGGGTLDATVDNRMGGLWVAKNITPGTYDLSIVESKGPYCPTRIFGVVVAANTRTVLNIALSPGETLDERGTPPVKTVTLTSTTGQIDELRAEVAGLQEMLARVTARLTALEALVKPDVVTPVPVPGSAAASSGSAAPPAGSVGTSERTVAPSAK